MGKLKLVLYLYAYCRSTPDTYSEKLIENGILSTETLKNSIQDHTDMPSDHLKQIETFIPPKSYLQAQWSNMIQPGEVITTWDTGIDTSLLKYIGAKSVEFPSDFVRYAKN